MTGGPSIGGLKRIDAVGLKSTKASCERDDDPTLAVTRRQPIPSFVERRVGIGMSRSQPTISIAGTAAVAQNRSEFSHNWPMLKCALCAGATSCWSRGVACRKHMLRVAFHFARREFGMVSLETRSFVFCLS